MSEFRDDLTHNSVGALDVMKVYAPIISMTLSYRELLWERPWIPQVGEVTYVPALFGGVEDDLYIEHIWYNENNHKLWLERGLVFKTKEEAIKCANKMLEVIK